MKELVGVVAPAIRLATFERSYLAAADGLEQRQRVAAEEGREVFADVVHRDLELRVAKGAQIDEVQELPPGLKRAWCRRRADGAAAVRRDGVVAKPWNTVVNRPRARAVKMALMVDAPPATSGDSSCVPSRRPGDLRSLSGEDCRRCQAITCDI
jgi:hypothetical protein